MLRRLSLVLLLLLALVLALGRLTTEAFAVRPTALITGGNRGAYIHSIHGRSTSSTDPFTRSPNTGLGKATAELLVDVGYHVILTARNEAEVRAFGQLPPA